jgi:hypothetical protein
MLCSYQEGYQEGRGHASGLTSLTFHLKREKRNGVTPALLSCAVAASTQPSVPGYIAARRIRKVALALLW